MESQPSKSIQSIYLPLYCIPPIVGSLIPVLASPDTEIPPPHLPIPKISACPFLHEDRVAQRSMSSTRYPNFSRIGLLLHGTVGTPTCRISGKRDGQKSIVQSQL